MNFPLLSTPRALKVENMSPVEFRQTAPGRWFLDFGRAAFGTLSFVSHMKRTSTVTVHLGEKLTDEGFLDRHPPGSIRYRLIETDVPAGIHRVQVVIPPDARNTGPAAIRMPSDGFEVLPFRYAEIEAGPEDTVRLPSRRAVFYPFDDRASSFRCSDERLNRVWDLCKYSIKATSFCGLYVDGDRERIPYEADAYINQLCHYGVDAEYEMARHTFEYLLSHPTWPTEWTLHFIPMAWADYCATGRTDVIETYYDVLRSKALMPLARDDGLISTQTGLVTPQLLETLGLKHHPVFSPQQMLRDLIDWPPGSFTDGGTGERDNYDMNTTVKTVINAFHAWNLERLSQVAATLGKTDDAAGYRRRFRQVVAALHQVCFDNARGIFLDGEQSTHASLHANMFPAAFGLLAREQEKRVGEFIRSRGMACSVYGSQYLLEACYRLDMADYALDLMTADHDRGWLNMLRAGSTITLEAWDHRYKNNLDWNHAWGAAPANIIPRFLVGVRPAQPGFTEVIVDPRPARIEAFDARVPTPLGPVHVQFDTVQGKCWLRVESPVPVFLKSAMPSAESNRLPAGRHALMLAHPKAVQS